MDNSNEDRYSISSSDSSNPSTPGASLREQTASNNNNNNNNNKSSPPLSSNDNYDNNNNRKRGLLTRSGLWVVYITVFIDLAGFGLIFPLLPYYVKELKADAFW